MNFKNFKAWHAERISNPYSPFNQPYPDFINQNAPLMGRMMSEWVRGWKGETIQCAGYENPACGESGFVFWYGSKENALLVSTEQNAPNKIIRHLDPSKYEGEFVKSMCQRHLVKSCDDPSGLTGFLVYDSDGVTWHCISTDVYVAHAAAAQK